MASGPVSSDAAVLYELASPQIGIATLNRPARLNAVDASVYRDLTRILTEVAREDNPVAVLILTGAGKYFTSGADLRAPGDVREDFSPFAEAVIRFPKILCVCVNGPAVGVGVTLLPHADFVYAAAHATFNTPFMNIALVPEFAASITFPRSLGWHAANDLLIGGKTFTAEEALRCNLINAIAPAGSSALQMGIEQAKTLLRHPLADKSLRIFKRMLRDPDRDELLRVHRAEVDTLCERVDAGDTLTAVTMFFARREEAASQPNPRPRL